MRQAGLVITLTALSKALSAVHCARPSQLTRWLSLWRYGWVVALHSDNTTVHTPSCVTQTMGVRSLAEAASFGSLPALMSKSQTAQEALTNACRRAVGLSEQLSEAQDLIEAKNSELDAVEQRLRASKDHADKLEAALEDAMDQALRWKETVRSWFRLRSAMWLGPHTGTFCCVKAEQLSVDLHNAGHIIGDLSSELEARAHLREQLDSAMNRIKVGYVMAR